MANDFDSPDGRGKRADLDDDAWFSGRAPEAAIIERPTTRPLPTTVILGVVIVALFVIGLALGAFSSPTLPVAPTAVGAIDVEAMRARARARPGLAALDEAELLRRLDALVSARRSMSGTSADTQSGNSVAAADTAAPEPIAIETGETVIAEAPAKPKVEPESKPKAETKPSEAKPLEPKAVEVKPAEVKPAEVKPAEVKPAEVKPAEVKPPETKPDATATSAIEQGLEAAKAAASKGKWAEAKAGYDKVLVMAPGNTKALFGRGRASFELRQLDAARKDLEKVLAAEPSHPSALRLLGSIAQEQGRKAEAKALYERFLAAYPSGRQAAEIRALLERL